MCDYEPCRYISYYFIVLHADVKLDGILIKTILDIIRKAPKWIQENKTLQEWYDFVKDWELYQTARKMLVQGTEVAVAYLWSHREDVIKFCRRHKDVITPLTSLPATVATKRAASTIGVKVAMSYGAKASSRGIRALRTVGNPATLAVDVVQTGLEITGHREAGMTVGFLGNIGTGAITGFMVAGPLGATIGATTCFASWFFGEIVAEAVDKSLS